MTQARPFLPLTSKAKAASASRASPFIPAVWGWSTCAMRLSVLTRVVRFVAARCALKVICMLAKKSLPPGNHLQWVRWTSQAGLVKLKTVRWPDRPRLWFRNRWALRCPENCILVRLQQKSYFLIYFTAPQNKHFSLISFYPFCAPKLHQLHRHFATPELITRISTLRSL